MRSNLYVCATAAFLALAGTAIAAPVTPEKPLPPGRGRMLQEPVDIEAGGAAGPNASGVNTARGGSLASGGFALTILTVAGPSVESLGESANHTHG